MPRTWGYWTRHKLAILESYLDAFTTAAKNKAPKPIYIDLLAGEGIGEDRIDGSQFEGSGRIAAKIDNVPFHRLYLVELSEANAARLHQIEHDFPDRDIRVRVGDCNDLIPEICAELRRDGLGYSPTFAFIDPDGLEVRWDTIEGLAHHRLASSRLSCGLCFLRLDSFGPWLTTRKDCRLTTPTGQIASLEAGAGNESTKRELQTSLTGVQLESSM